MKKKFAVLGDPIDHSWSPSIHKAFAEQFSLSIEYNKIKVEKGTLEQNLRLLLSKNYLGFNVTVPLKEEAYILALEKDWKISFRAKKAQAVNTLLWEHDKFFADNTDGFGLFKSLHHHGLFEINHSNVLVIGAGGAVRGILPMFLKNDFEKVTIVNRGDTKLLELSRAFKSKIFSYCTLNDFNARSLEKNHIRPISPKFDLIINGTSTGIQNSIINISSEIFLKCPLVVDLFYSHEPTSFMQFASEGGAKKVIDGLGMLVEQAAESFYIWTEKRPITKEVLDKARLNLLCNE